jgi:glycosyltransferase involved in cell wall biosynthesis
MRLLITGVNYAPEETGIAPYTTGLAEHLVRRGHQVSVVTGVPSYPQWRVYPEYRRLFLARELRQGVEVRRVRNYVPRRQSTLQRGLYEASFLVGGLTRLSTDRPDAVLGVVPSLSGGLLARAAAHRLGCPYGVVIQDLIGPAVSQSGVGTSRAAGLIGAAEARAVRGASAVGVIAEGFRPYLHSLGVASERIRRVRNWLHVQEPTLDRAAVRRRLDLPAGAVICLHAGNMGYKQGLANIIECARLAAEAEPDLLFVLMGDGNQRQELVRLAQNYRLRNLRFLPIQPDELFTSALAAADVLLVNQRSSVTNMSLPGKLTSYFASGRPVVAAVSPESETARELVEAETGILVPPDQPEALLEELRKLAVDIDRQDLLGAAGSHYARTVLSASQALAGLEALILAVAADRSWPSERST